MKPLIDDYSCLCSNYNELVCLSSIFNLIKINICEKFEIPFVSWCDFDFFYDYLNESADPDFNENVLSAKISVPFGKFKIPFLNIFLKVSIVDENDVIIDLSCGLPNGLSRVFLSVEKKIYLYDHIKIDEFLKEDLVIFYNNILNYRGCDIIEKENIGIEFYMNYL